jgi:Kef-type K+ transport system membrane component KefB
VPRGRRAWLGVGAGLLVLISAGALVVTGVAGTNSGPQPIDPVTRFLVAAALVLTVCHLFGGLMRRIGQPPVLGEIIGGLLLGPSALGLVWPGATAWLFPPVVITSLNTAAQLGLVVFMFLLGCGLRTDRIESKRMVAASVVGGMGLPFLVGTGIALATGTLLAGGSATRTSHALFFGLAMAITALPVLARILVELDIQHTKVGTLALSSAAIGDGVAWLTLTVILASVGAGGARATVTAFLALALVLATWLCLRPALAWLVERVRSEQVLTVVLLAGAIGYAALTQTIHLHPLIGAFLFGVAVPRDCAAVDRIRQQLIGFTLMVLLPLFFAGVGLVTSIGLLGANAWHWLLFLGVVVAAQVTKFVGAGVATRLVGLPGREAVQLGVLMNCRGVTELVVATVGLQYGLVNGLGFTMLVLVAVITTAMTGPIMRRLTGNPARPSAYGMVAPSPDRIEERTTL